MFQWGVTILHKYKKMYINDSKSWKRQLVNLLLMQHLYFKGITHIKYENCNEIVIKLKYWKYECKATVLKLFHLVPLVPHLKWFLEVLLGDMFVLDGLIAKTNIFPFCCIFPGISSRTLGGPSTPFWEPWYKLLADMKKVNSPLSIHYLGGKKYIDSKKRSSESIYQTRSAKFHPVSGLTAVLRCHWLKFAETPPGPPCCFWNGTRPWASGADQPAAEGVSSVCVSGINTLYRGFSLSSHRQQQLLSWRSNWRWQRPRKSAWSVLVTGELKDFWLDLNAVQYLSRWWVCSHLDCIFILQIRSDILEIFLWMLHRSWQTV